jgi:hypothetical protein
MDSENKSFEINATTGIQCLGEGLQRGNAKSPSRRGTG